MDSSDDNLQPVGDDIQYRRALRQKNFIALLATQFLTAFNDNLFRWLVVPIGEILIGESAALAWGAVLFTVPYLIFAPTAGYLADRFSKRSVILACKFAEILVMIIGVIGIWYGNVYLLLFLVFCMGTQSALFSPAKIGTIPEILPVRALSEGNGLMAMVTIVACALGTFGGLQLFHFCYGEDGTLDTLMPIALSLVGIAIAGWLVSLLVTTPAAADPERKWAVNPVDELKPSLQRLFNDRPLAQAALGIAFFYFLAILYQVNIKAFGSETLALNEGQVAFLMPMLVLGIGIGSVMAGLVSGGIIQLGMVPFGIMGIAFSTMVLGILGFGIDSSTAAAVNSGFWATAVWLFLLGFVGSFFYIPLESFLQHRSPPEIRGSILSAANALTNSFMLASMGLFYVLREPFQLSPAFVFLIVGIIAVPVVVMSFATYARQVFVFSQRCLMNCLYRVHLHGFDKLPKEGGALIVPNHISWMDGPLLCSFLPRMTRFMIYADYTEVWWLRWASSLNRVIPLSPKFGPKAIIKALKDARNSAMSGEMVCIFPEGGISRTGRLMTFNKGVVKIVQGSDVPVYPVYIHGMWGSRVSYRGGGLFKSPWKWRRRVDIYIGDPHTDVNDVGVLHRTVEEIAADSLQDQMLRRPLLIQQFVKQCRSSMFRTKVADSSGIELTGGRLLIASIAFQKVLEREVFAKDEQNVGILLPPSVGGVLVNAAVTLSKRVGVNLNYTLDDRILNHCIKDSGISHVITSRKFLEKRPVELDAEVICVEDLKEKVSGGDKLKGILLGCVLPSMITERLLGLHQIDPNSLLTIVYTSGSTGEPKGVMLSHLNVLANVEAVDYMFTLSKDDALIGILPFFHSFGYTISMWLVMAMNPMGAYHFNPLDSRQVGKLSEKYKGTILLATPTFLRSYLKRIPTEQMQHMWLVVVGAEKLPVDLSAACQEKFGVTPIEGYGSTEMSPLVAANQPDIKDSKVELSNNRLGTVGQCVPGVYARVVNPDTHEELPLESEGLLFVTGANVMQGYLNLPDKTAEVIEDGWYNTGDFAKIDYDGFITLTGRQSRFSKIAGEMVPHIKIEETLCSILDRLSPASSEEADAPPLLRVAVTAVPDEKKGERIVVLHTKLSIEKEAWIKELHASELPNLWTPGSDCFLEVEQIPLLGTGKMDLRGVKETALGHFVGEG